MSIHRPTLARRAVRVTAMVAVGALVLVASPALADVPSGWPEPPPVPLLDGLMIYLVAPLTLVVLITLLTITPSLVRGERPGVGTTDDQWFGGPRSGTHELQSGEPDSSKTGGASGGW